MAAEEREVFLSQRNADDLLFGKSFLTAETIANGVIQREATKIREEKCLLFEYTTVSTYAFRKYGIRNKH